MKIGDMEVGVTYSLHIDGEKVGYMMLQHSDPAVKRNVKREASRWMFVINWRGEPDDHSLDQRRLAKRLLETVEQHCDITSRAKTMTRDEAIMEAAIEQGLGQASIRAILDEAARKRKPGHSPSGIYSLKPSSELQLPPIEGELL